MSTISLRSPVSELKFVGEKSAPKLERLGIRAVIDLLFHFPSRYEDRTRLLSILDALQSPGETVTVKGDVTDIKQIYIKARRMHITTVTIQDGSGLLPLVWFRQSYIAKQLREGGTVAATGKMVEGRQGLQMQPSNYEKIGVRAALHSGRIVPIYPETKGVSSKYLRFLVDSVLHLTEDVPESFSSDFLADHDLLGVSKALRQIHFPDSNESLASARARFAFEELFFVQLHTALEQQAWKQQSATPLDSRHTATVKFRESLPYTLTGAQTRSWNEIAKDLASSTPMNRLLEGDVGSGKTVVSALALLAATVSKQQSVLVAPTEILARQHFETLSNLLRDYCSIALVTGKTRLVNRNQFGLFSDDQTSWLRPTRKELLSQIASGTIDVIIGTHAVLQPTVAYAALGLVVIDEQHRFGVDQRDVLLKRGTEHSTPHLLTMSATPIPRTLSMTLFGHLQLSVLDEMPPGRKPILTKLVDETNRDKAYEFIRERLSSGRQAYVITPLVEESDLLDAKAATAEFDRLQKTIFRDYTVGLLHGRMKVIEKEQVMSAFAAGDIDVLVSTSVVEVGVDVPNATMMIIEGAERFGLSQLHQFRGRVGRGEHQSFCFLFATNASASSDRLEAFVKNTSGFDLAEMDLELRGPGNLFGKEQSGVVSQLRIADLRDTALVSRVQRAVEQLLEKDPDLASHTDLRLRLQKFRDSIHFE